METEPEWFTSWRRWLCFLEASVSLPACGLSFFGVRLSWTCVLALGILGCSQPHQVLVFFSWNRENYFKATCWQCPQDLLRGQELSRPPVNGASSLSLFPSLPVPPPPPFQGTRISF